MDVDAIAGAIFSFATTWPFFNGLSGTTLDGDGVAGIITTAGAAAFTFAGVTFFATGTTTFCFFSTTISTATFASTKNQSFN